MRKMILAPFLSFVVRVWWRIVLLECERLLLEVLLSLCKGRSQNYLNVQIGIDFSALWNKNERRLPCFGNSGPHHDKGRFLAPENLSHEVRNVYRKLSKDTIILSVKHCFDIEHFLIWENDLACVRTWLHFCSSEALFFLEVCEVVASLQFDGGELQIALNDIPHLLTHIYFLSHFPHWTLGIVPDSCLNCINDIWSVRSSWSTTSRTIFSTVQFFKPINSVINSLFWCLISLNWSCSRDEAQWQLHVYHPY